MSLEKFFIVTAVPFHLARMQNSAVNIARRTVDLSTREISCNDNLNNRKRKKHDSLSRMAKILLRKQKNREASTASRQRQKIREEFLTNKILNLQMETAKLLLEKEKLQTHFLSLESENVLLKKSLEDSGTSGVLDWRDVEETLRHAWSVSVPRLKEWVFPHLLLTFLAVLVESAKINFPIANAHQLYHLSPLLSSKSLGESLLQMIFFPWRMMSSSMNYQKMIS